MQTIEWAEGLIDVNIANAGEETEDQVRIVDKCWPWSSSSTFLRAGLVLSIHSVEVLKFKLLSGAMLALACFRRPLATYHHCTDQSDAMSSWVVHHKSAPSVTVLIPKVGAAL